MTDTCLEFVDTLKGAEDALRASKGAFIDEGEIGCMVNLHGVVDSCERDSGVYPRHRSLSPVLSED